MSHPHAMAGMLTFGEAMGLISATGIGSLDVARAAHIGIGGAESNVAIGVARLGAPATWLGRVGDDAIGRLIAYQLTGAGVRTIALTDPSYTGLMIRHSRTASTVQIDYHRSGSAGSRLQRVDIPEQDIVNALVLHVTGITPSLSDSAREATFHAVDVAHQAGVTVTFDVNYRSKLWPPERAAPVLRTLATRADVLFASPAEALLLTGGQDRDIMAIARSVAALGPRRVILKDGANGCHAVDGDTELSRPAITVSHVVDAVGAGDAFVAGFICELLDDAPLHRCLDTALLMGAFAVSVPGDCELLPTRPELRDFATATDVSR